MLQVIQTRKLTRARNVVFDEAKVLGFNNETRNSEDDLLFDVSFDEENLAPDNQNIVRTKIMGEYSLEPLV